MDDRDDLSGMAPLVPERQERKFVGRSADGQRVVLFNEPPLHPGATQSAELWQASAGAFGASEAIPQLSRCQSGLAGLRHPLQCGLLPPSLSPSFVMPSLEGQGSPLNLSTHQSANSSFTLWLHHWRSHASDVSFVFGCGLGAWAGPARGGPGFAGFISVLTEMKVYVWLK